MFGPRSREGAAPKQPGFRTHGSDDDDPFGDRMPF
jgi:hypothetical protein